MENKLTRDPTPRAINNTASTVLEQKKEFEKTEEEKFKAKYKLQSGWPSSGHSVFLQKKLAKGQKFFDSGDYQMAKQSNAINKNKAATSSQPLLNIGTGNTIPTPETVPARKTSIIQSKYNPST